MSNSSLVNYTKLSPNRNCPRNHAIDRITPHCYVGQVSVESMAGWLCNPNATASSNYGIGADGKIGMFVPESDRSWCSSSRDNDNRAVTIECASDSFSPYKINDSVYKQLVKLMADICKRNGKTRIIWFGDKNKTLAYTPKQDEMIITVHRWFANKACPGDYIYTRLGQIANEVNAILGNTVTEQPIKEELYRVRKSWANADSQLFAGTLEGAKRMADKHPGYYVFDSVGKVVYGNPDATSSAAVSKEAKGVPASKEDFIAKVSKIAMNLYKETKILPSVVIAQCCLETGYGMGSDAIELTKRNNLLGMKSDLINTTWKEFSVWDGTSFRKRTPEVYNGRTVYIYDNFRMYKDYENCIRDYEMFLLHVKSGGKLKYADIAGMTNPKDVITIISQRGYATDPAYIKKVIKLINENNFTKYDKQVLVDKTVKWTGYVKRDGAVVRTAPGAGKPELAKLQKGTKVGICFTTKSAVGNRWYYINYDKDRYGYLYIRRVSKTYVQPVKTTAEKASENAILIANNNAHGYNNALDGRGGNPDYACSSFVTDCYIKAGIDFGVSCDKVVTAGMRSLFIACGFVDISSNVNLRTGEGIVEGDVLIKPGTHAEIFIGDGRVAGARGNAQAMKPENGKAGDQTGTEIAISKYYYFGQTVCLRYYD